MDSANGWFYSIAAFVLVLMLDGCASRVPMMPEKYDLAAEKFEPKTGKGNVYVVRGKLGASFTVLGLGSGGTATLLHVDLDGRRYGSLTTGTYMLFELDPGRYVLLTFWWQRWDALIAIRH